MAPVYLAKSLEARETPSPLFAMKGVLNRAPERLSTLACVGLPFVRQLAYDAYKSNIDAFVAATAAKKKMFVGLDAYPFYPRGRLPLATPLLRFSLQKELTKDQAERLRGKLGDGATLEARKQSVFTAPALPDDIADKIYTVANPNFTPGFNEISPAGHRAFRFICGFIHEFLCTHTYPAFTSDPREESYMELKAAVWSDENIGEYHSHKPNEGKVREIRTLSATANRENYVEEAQMETDDDESEIETVMDFYRRRDGEFTVNMVDHVVTAKPSPGCVDNNCGSVAKVPELPGLVFPYFEGLVNSDPNVFKQFVGSFAIRLLGSSRKEVEDNYVALRRGFNSLALTKQGRALSHIMTMVQIALESQARLYVVMENEEYMGSVLLGHGFSVCVGGHKWFTPVDAKELREDLAVLDPHLKAVTCITTKLGELKVAGSYTGPTVLERELSPADLIPVLEGLSLQKIDDRDIGELDSYISRLNFRGPGYKAVSTTEYIAEFVEQFFSDEAVEIGIPCFIPSIRSDLNDRAFILLSKFGPDAPSFWNQKGKEIDCVATEVEEAPGPSGKRKRGNARDLYGNMPEVLLVTPKPLAVAVSDWNNNVMRRKAVKMDFQERAGRFRNKGITNDVLRKRIWKAMVEGLESQKKIDTGKGKGKAVEGYDDMISDLLD